MTMPRFHTHTVESFLDWWEGREGRYELHQGGIIEMPPPRSFHQGVATTLAILLGHYLLETRIGKARQEAGLTLGPQLYCVPDLMIFRTEDMPEGWETRDMEALAPAIVIEVLSPSTRRFDLNQKREFYAQAGIPEYWIVDPEAQAFTFLRLADGAYGESALVGSIYETPLLPGFSLNTATFWEDVR